MTDEKVVPFPKQDKPLAECRILYADDKVVLTRFTIQTAAGPVVSHNLMTLP